MGSFSLKKKKKYISLGKGSKELCVSTLDIIRRKRNGAQGLEGEGKKMGERKIGLPPKSAVGSSNGLAWSAWSFSEAEVAPGVAAAAASPPPPLPPPPPPPDAEFSFSMPVP